MAIMTFSKGKIVCVEWEDAASNSGYYDKDKPGNTTTVMTKTVGFLAEKNKRVVKVCAESFEDGDCRYVHSIPKGMVRKITVLSEKG